LFLDLSFFILKLQDLLIVHKVAIIDYVKKSKDVKSLVKDIHFGRNYGAMYRKTTMFIRECFKPFGVTFAEMIILTYVLDYPGTSQDDIARNLAVDKTAIARSIKNLETLGLLVRKENFENQRMKMVYATPKAHEYKAHFDKVMHRWNEILLMDFSDEEQEFILSAFARMRRQAIEADIEIEVARQNDGIELG